MEQKYLLRVWEDCEQDDQSWQASLKNLETKETQFFADFQMFQKHFVDSNLESATTKETQENLKTSLFRGK